MANGYTYANDSFVVKQRIFGNNAVRVAATEDLPAYSGYKAVGVVGYYPGGGWSAGEYLAQIFVDIDNQKLSVAWSVQVSTSVFLEVMILYIKS